MANYHSLYTGAEIDEAVGRALPNGAIDTSLSNKADSDDHNLKTYTSFSQIGNPEISVFSDIVDAVPNGAELNTAVYIDGTQSYYPNITGGFTLSVCRINGYYVATLSQIAIATRYIKSGWYNIDTWVESNWVAIATATSSAEVPLDLASGFTVVDGFSGIAFKTQEHNVTVSASIYIPQDTLEFGTLVATVPAGFTPKYKQGVLAQLEGSSSAGEIASVDIETSGDIRVFWANASSEAKKLKINTTYIAD